MYLLSYSILYGAFDCVQTFQEVLSVIVHTQGSRPLQVLPSYDQCTSTNISQRMDFSICLPHKANLPLPEIKIKI